MSKFNYNFTLTHEEAQALFDMLRHEICTLKEDRFRLNKKVMLASTHASKSKCLDLLIEFEEKLIEKIISTAKKVEE
jgi:hypothetical protein